MLCRRPTVIRGTQYRQDDFFARIVAECAFSNVNLGGTAKRCLRPILLGRRLFLFAPDHRHYRKDSIERLKRAYQEEKSMNENKIIIFDTTLRDGEQTPGVNLNIEEKLEIARQLEEMGVDVIEAGFPASSDGDFEAVKAVAQAMEKCSVAGLCRSVAADIDRAWEALKYARHPRIHIFLATSDIHMQHKLKMMPEEVFEAAVASVTMAKSYCDDIEFSCEDASRSNPAFIYKIIEAVIDAGATTINVPDPVGYAVPEEFASFIRGIKENVPNINKAILSVHCHNDLGMATANTIAAIQQGVRQIETTINGLGERAGNCSMEEVIMAITTRQAHMGVSTDIDTTQIYPTSRIVSEITGVPISITKAIVGDNAFAHESGIHQHGVLSNPMTYEIMTPQSVGKTESVMVLGKLSGRHAFSDRIRAMGFEMEREEINKAFKIFKDLCDKQKRVSDEEIAQIITDHCIYAQAKAI